MKIGRGNEVLGDNLPQRHFVHHKSYLPDPGSNPGRRCGKPATNRLSYGMYVCIVTDMVSTSQYVCMYICMYVRMYFLIFLLLLVGSD
jgi:hypothetical protein